MSDPTKYTAYVFPELGSARLDAQWSRIAEQLPLPTNRRRWSSSMMVAFGAVCAAIVAVYGWTPRVTDSAWEGSVVASDEAPVNLTLGEGTLIELDPRSQVSLMRSGPARVQVSLTDGSARFEVAKKRSRRFSVQMGAVEVVVTGTQFRVARRLLDGGERVRVDVEEGSVEVHRQGVGMVTLQAGDHWSAFVAGEDDVVEPTLGQEDDALSVGPDKQSPRPVRARAAADADGAGRDKRRSVKPQMQGADELFEQANVARRAGSVAESARLFGELIARHPRDHRAALAAFELGRLRMDSLADLSGAVDALERALKLDSRRAFAEDALARLVLAHEGLGDRASCTKARARYLARYPDGVHSQHISARCGGI